MSKLFARMTPILISSLVGLAVFSPIANAATLSSIQKTKFPNATTAVIVRSTSGKILYQQNASVPMQPASDTKVLTAVAALHLLGSKFRFLTSIKQSAQNYYVVFSGDPSFRSSTLKRMFTQLRQKGVRTIKGNVYIDNTAFTGPGHGLGIVADDLNYGFAAPIQSVLISENTVPLLLTQTKSGVKVKSASGFSVNSSVRFVSSGTLKTCIFRPSMNDQNQISVKGCLSDRKSWQFKLAVKNPNLYAKYLIQTYLGQAGVKLNGPVLYGRAPSNAKLIIAHHSDTLGLMLGHMLRYSDNIYAGALTKQIGKAYYGVGSMKAGVNGIDQVVSKMAGIKPSQIEIEDGAGASRYNHISPRAMSDVLLAAYRNKNIRTWLYRNLPVSGQTGTLAYRMQSKSLRGKVRAKTGSMSGVSTLAGYVKARSGKTLVFAIMMNNFTGSLRTARSTQDLMVKRISQVF